MKNKNISRACLAAALVMAGTVSAHASALRSSAPETEAAVMIMDNTRMARPKAKIVKEYAPTNRPAESERLFRSEAVEAEIARIKGVLSNAKLAWMFENCFPNTLDTTVRYRKDDNGKDDTVVYTGDIHAMWLRELGCAGVALPPAGQQWTSTCAVCWPALSAASSSASSSIPMPMRSSTPTTRTPTISG